MEKENVRDRSVNIPVSTGLQNVTDHCGNMMETCYKLICVAVDVVT